MIRLYSQQFCLSSLQMCTNKGYELLTYKNYQSLSLSAILSEKEALISSYWYRWGGKKHIVHPYLKYGT